MASSDDRYKISERKAVAERVELRRNIGLFMAVMIGIGAMMGPGIFALPGEMAHMVGPLGIFAYLAMGLLTIFTALKYSELGVVFGTTWKIKKPSRPP